MTRTERTAHADAYTKRQAGLKAAIQALALETQTIEDGKATMANMANILASSTLAGSLPRLRNLRRELEAQAGKEVVIRARKARVASDLAQTLDVPAEEPIAIAPGISAAPLISIVGTVMPRDDAWDANVARKRKHQEDTRCAICGRVMYSEAAKSRAIYLADYNDEAIVIDPANVEHLTAAGVAIERAIIGLDCARKYSLTAQSIPTMPISA